MKIEKLYTLSQFVDYVYSEDNWKITTCDFNSLYERKAYYFDLIVNYMQFLKQPLRKEMIMHDLVKPNLYGEPRDCKYATELKEWQEAENKIIFKSNLFELDNEGVWIGCNFAYFNSPLRNIAELENIELKNVEL